MKGDSRNTLAATRATGLRARLALRLRALRLRWSFLILAGLASLAPALAPAQTTREYDLKAVFLYNFASFVTWPASAFDSDASPFVIGIVGEDPFGKVLDDIVAGEFIGRRPLVVRRYRRGDEEIGRCHLLFISVSESRRLDEILEAVRGRPVLTVADVSGFAETGGMIGFGRRENRVQLYVNPGAVRSASLTVSSKLLELAQIVGGLSAAP